ncbi:hypothetical protein GCK32_013986 [Trichostrongylus colubriformis]|uniref:Uncharacterized protein n=1 Tax=Trichostrongylus colubriformis TaxID=6319 RepID=A0AAN8IT26_TRICO
MHRIPFAVPWKAYMLQNNVLLSQKRPRPYKRREESKSGIRTTDVLIVGILVVIPVCIVIIAALSFVRSKNRKMKQMPNAPHAHGNGAHPNPIKMVRSKTQKESWQGHSNQPIVAAMRPKKMKSEQLDIRKFKDRGPLEMRTEYKGTVRHDLDVEGSESLRDLKYDQDLNSFVLIGTTVETLMPQRSRIGPPSKSKRGGDLSVSAEGLKTASKESVKARQDRPAANFVSDSKSSVQKLSKRNDISSAQSKSSVEKWQPRNAGGDKTPRYYNLADLQKQRRK